MGGGLQILGLVGWALAVTGAKYPLERCGESNTESSSDRLPKIDFLKFRIVFFLFNSKLIEFY